MSRDLAKHQIMSTGMNRAERLGRLVMQGKVPGVLLAGPLAAPPEELIPQDLSVRNHPNRLCGESDFSSEVIVRS
jgi:hypothetical protein